MNSITATSKLFQQITKMLILSFGINSGYCLAAMQSQLGTIDASQVNLNQPQPIEGAWFFSSSKYQTPNHFVESMQQSRPLELVTPAMSFKKLMGTNQGRGYYGIKLINLPNDILALSELSVYTSAEIYIVSEVDDLSVSRIITGLS